MAQIDKEIIFMENVTTPTSGLVFYPSKNDKIYVEIYGTSTSRTVTFNATLFSGALVPILATNISNGVITNSTTGIGTEIWEIRTQGLTSININLTAVGGGNVTIKGKSLNV